MKIYHKLILGFLVIALLVGVVGYFGFSGTQFVMIFIFHDLITLLPF